MGIITVFLLLQAAGAGLTVFPMNFWTGIFVGLLCVICMNLRVTKPVTTEAGAGAVSAPVTVAR
jgi:hypothetical protein